MDFVRKISDGKTGGFRCQCQHCITNRTHPGVFQIDSGQTALATLRRHYQAVKCIVGEETFVCGLYDIEKIDRHSIA